jgi:3-deoxy-D-manno-octulosonic-acid transferase
MRVAVVNGRISERSFKRYGYFKRTMKRLLGYLDRALMQSNADANRLMALGLRASKARVTGNLKFDHDVTAAESELTEEFRRRFGIIPEAPLIIAASTHSPEEEWILEAFKAVWKRGPGGLPRLMIAPRHPERFAEVAEILKKTGFTWVRRSEAESPRDKAAEVILLDSIGELRAAYPLAEIVFVGGSLVPHGGQSILEPAASGRAIITGPHTSNFAEIVQNFLEREAIIQLENAKESEVSKQLASALGTLLARPTKRKVLGERARAVMDTNRGAVERTLEHLEPLLAGSSRQTFQP